MSHILSQEQGGQLDGLKISVDYVFKATDRLVTLNDTDVKGVVSIFNATTNNMVFIASSETLTGSMHGKSIVFDISSSGMSDSDELYIAYESDDTVNIEGLLVGIIDELKINNKLLKKIYNPK